ncbi:hypothetical protein JCM9533A_07330 [Catenuloplanes niger JCM 9533]
MGHLEEQFVPVHDLGGISLQSEQRIGAHVTRVVGVALAGQRGTIVLPLHERIPSDRSGRFRLDPQEIIARTVIA